MCRFAIAVHWLCPFFLANAVPYARRCKRRFPLGKIELTLCFIDMMGDEELLEKSKLLLKRYFGFENFRNGQEGIVMNAVKGGDSLVVMPTGGGKSLCYQLPALMFEKGVTLVVSPLIALMKDQVDSLRLRGISCEFINSSLKCGEIRRIHRDLLDDKIRIAYLAPERLQTPDFAEILSRLSSAGLINLFAIDEAHCISEWGCDFRPDYRKLSLLRKEHPKVPIMALTATATPKVREDITVQLKLAGETFLTSFDRPNLFYSVVPRDDEAFFRIIDEGGSGPEGPMRMVVRKRPLSAIVYCHTRKNVENLVDKLSQRGNRVDAYHAGMDDSDRSAVQDRFINGETDIIVATIAFGMGIDKPDVCLVIHYNLPKSIEGYYQETGRAGRDGLYSECILLYKSADTVKQLGGNSTVSKIRDMNDYAISDQCRRQLLLGHFREPHPGNCGMCDNCIRKDKGEGDDDKYDPQNLSRNILAAVSMLRFEYGERYIVKILMGKGRNDKKVINNRHDKLPIYGIEQLLSEEDVKRGINNLINRKMLFVRINRSSRGPSTISYPTIAITELGLQHIDPERDYAPSCRAVTAIKKNTPNRTRRTGVTAISATPTQPVAPTTVATTAATAATTAATTTATASSVPVALSGTVAKTWDLIKEGKTLEETAEIRGIKMRTALDHLIEVKKSIPECSVLMGHLRPEEHKLKMVSEAIAKNGTGSELLKPIKSMLNDELSYDQIRICKLFLP